MKLKEDLLLGRKVMTNLDSIFKSRDITLPTKVHLVKAMVFPVVMYGCETWTVKKAESWRIDAFELCCWRRLLRVPRTARRSNQSILKEIIPGISLEGMMLPGLWLSYAKSWLIGKDSDAGRDWGQEEKGMTEDEMAGWHHWLHGHEFKWTPAVGYGQGGLACCSSWGCKESDTTEWLNWTELNWWPPSVDTKPTLNLSCSAHSFHVSSQMYSWHKSHTRQCVWVSSAGSWLWDFFAICMWLWSVTWAYTQALSGSLLPPYDGNESMKWNSFFCLVHM